MSVGAVIAAVVNITVHLLSTQVCWCSITLHLLSTQRAVSAGVVVAAIVNITVHLLSTQEREVLE